MRVLKKSSSPSPLSYSNRKGPVLPPEMLTPTFSRAIGSYFVDDQGHRYLDLGSGGHVANCGWNNPEVFKAFEDQLQAGLTFVPPGNNHPGQEQLIAKWNRLLAYTNHGWTYFQGVTQSESIDIGIQAARNYTGRKGVLSFQRSHHGVTLGAGKASGLFQEPYFTKLPLPSADPKGKWQVLEKLNAALEAQPKPAVLVMETMNTAAGLVYVPDLEFYDSIFQACRRNGVLVMMDESNVGLFRTGKLFSFQHFELIPDIVVVGKALGNGLVPISTAMMKQEIGRCIDSRSAYGWTPLSAATALATLHFLTESGLEGQVLRKGEFFQRKLKILERQSPVVHEVRGMGLEIGMEFRIDGRPLGTKDQHGFQDALLQQGLLAQFQGEKHTTLIIAPPLTISTDQINDAVRGIEAAIQDHFG